MSLIKLKSKAEDESVGGGNKFFAAPRGFYTLGISTASSGEVTRNGDPITKFVCEIVDGPYAGKKIWHNVTWIPRGNETEPRPGHGIAVHFLHGVGMQFDGELQFDESEFVGKTFRALLEVEDYKNGQYTNEKNTVARIYTDDHPEPKELPPAPVKATAAPGRAAAATAGASSGEALPF